MERMIKLLLVIASLMTVELTVTESKDNDNKKKIRVERPYYHPALTNVCDIVDRRSKVHCYCDSTKQKMATWADCWVFSGELTEDDSIWPSFSTQSNIEHLIFNVRTDDALTFIPAKALIRLDHLKHLTIQFGSIRSIPPFAFNNLTNIRQIALKSNRITNLEVHSFSKLMMLTNLSLEDNLISELQRDVFVGLPNLHIFHLTSNNLSLIHEGCFRHLNNLIELKLDSNYISVVTRETFEGLQNLARLDLRNNKMTMIGNLAFSELWGLKELLLDNNAIEYISERSFGGLTQMTKLSLSGNKLTAFYEDIIEEIRSLVVLDLSDNLLDTISYETIRSVVENEKSSATALYLDGNPLTCDCRLAWIYSLRNETEDNTLRAALEKVSCITDPTIAKRLKETDEDKNKGTEDYYYEEKASDNNILYDEPKRDGLTSAITLSDIPLKILPCPKELLQTLDKTHQHPVQNEIRLKAFSNGDRPFIRVVSIVSVAMLILVSFH